MHSMWEHNESSWEKPERDLVKNILHFRGTSKYQVGTDTTFPSSSITSHHTPITSPKWIRAPRFSIQPRPRAAEMPLQRYSANTRHHYAQTEWYRIASLFGALTALAITSLISPFPGLNEPCLQNIFLAPHLGLFPPSKFLPKEKHSLVFSGNMASYVNGTPD